MNNGIEPTIEDKMTLIPETKVGTTPAELVERAGNAGGGVFSFRKELSNAESLFDSVVPIGLDRFKLPEETAGVLKGVKPTGYDSSELKAKIEIKNGNDFHSGNVWVGTKAEGVPD